MDENCIFCKLANGVFATNMIYEDEDFAAFLDASPATKGHTLLVPKKHAANVFELPDEIGAKIFPVAKKVAANLTEKLGCDGINILQNNGVAAGQTVFHLHVHLIPRMENDDKIIEWSHLEPTDEEQKKTCDLLKM